MVPRNIPKSNLLYYTYKFPIVYCIILLFCVHDIFSKAVFKLLFQNIQPLPPRWRFRAPLVVFCFEFRGVTKYIKRKADVQFIIYIIKNILFSNMCRILPTREFRKKIVHVNKIIKKQIQSLTYLWLVPWADRIEQKLIRCFWAASNHIIGC